jgi:hypothetical protein
MQSISHGLLGVERDVVLDLAVAQKYRLLSPSE